jgi:recombination protein RecR
MYSPSIEKLIKIFSKFPTVGPRTAARFVFYLLKIPPEEIEKLLTSIKELREKIRICSLCFKPFEDGSKEEAVCSICSDRKRDGSLICIVEKEIDLEAIEKTKQYKGLYFILGGLFSGLTKEENKKKLEKRVNQLIERLKSRDSDVEEVILALNPTPEGEQTIFWLKRKLKNIINPKTQKPIRITQLGKGLPAGGELEYADEDTLLSAFQGRK